jgi:predicted NUDIX family phosphoesterase
MPSSATEERVLVVPTSEFLQLGHFQGFCRELDRYLPALLEGEQLSYRPRSEMEQDPAFKQLIPYVLLRWHDAEGAAHLFQYTRGGGQGEARLHARRSVGIGGHISLEDAAAGDRRAVYREGMLRELSEEIAIAASYREECVGLINDDLTAVGRVHLGVVHLLDLDQPAVEPREADLLAAGFLPADRLLDEIDQFETWSQIALRALFAPA